MSTLHITTIQSILHWEDKEANLLMFTDKINSLQQPTHVVVLPEMFTTGFSMNTSLAETMDGATIQWMRTIAQQKKVIVTGSVMIQEDDCYYNRLIWMQPNGQLGYYNKRHLFGFGKEDAHYKAGNSKLITQVNGFKINVQICYDLRFPVWARQSNASDSKYDVLLYVANWPQKRSHAWKTLLTARAIENQCYVVGVNRVGNDGNKIYHSGNTMVVDALGEILYHEADKEAIHTITLQKETLDAVRQQFPFLKDADDFNILV
ncbi:amidohydrolase [Ferruginibacter yonginensis]|uniref:Amidohydrolase n=1 Tax=Ferruginibacter yonginensis TaxID=1310416 RepID=A0ABV8QTD6_9BACT